MKKQGKDIDIRKLSLRGILHTGTGRWLILAGLALSAPIFGSVFSNIEWFGLFIFPLMCFAILFGYKKSVNNDTVAASSKSDKETGK